MHERVEAATPDTPELAAAPSLRQGSVVERVLALQRSAGNAAVTRLIARQEAGQGAIDTRPTEFVFILGAKHNDALKVAKEHYRSPLMSSLSRKVIAREDMSDPTLAGIFDFLRQVSYPISEITIVVHGDAEGDLIVPLNSASKSDKTTPDEVDKALDEGVLKPLNDGQITSRPASGSRPASPAMARGWSICSTGRSATAPALSSPPPSRSPMPRTSGTARASRAGG